jgi:hypothetical protein
MTMDLQDEETRQQRIAARFLVEAQERAARDAQGVRNVDPIEYLARHAAGSRALSQEELDAAYKHQMEGSRNANRLGHADPSAPPRPPWWRRAVAGLRRLLP